MSYLVRWLTSDSDVRNGSYTIGYTCYRLGVHEIVTETIEEAVAAFNERAKWGLDVFIALNGKMLVRSTRDEYALITLKSNAVNKTVVEPEEDSDDIEVDEIGHEVDSSEYEGGEE